MTDWPAVPSGNLNFSGSKQTTIREVQDALAADSDSTRTLLKQQFAIKTFSDWTDAAPRLVEVDLVADCGWTGAGPFPLHAHVG